MKGQAASKTERRRRNNATSGTSLNWGLQGGPWHLGRRPRRIFFLLLTHSLRVTHQSLGAPAEKRETPALAAP